MIVISADRPQNKIDIGDGQTIRQENVLGNHSLYNANLREDALLKRQSHSNGVACCGCPKRTSSYQCAFEEPLYENGFRIKSKPEIVDFNTEEKTFSLGNSTQKKLGTKPLRNWF